MRPRSRVLGPLCLRMGKSHKWEEATAPLDGPATGFIDTPNLSGQILETILEEFRPTVGTRLLQYVDDLLISGEGNNEVSDATISLFNFLGQKGLRISQNKLQFVEKKEVKSLGYLISEGRE